jgi:glycosyltransferase involved in cell wall biosynthesis
VPTLGNFVQKHAEAMATAHRVTALYISPDASVKTGFETEQVMVAGVATTIVYYPVSKRGFFTKWRAFSKGLKLLKKQSAADFDLVHFNIIWNAGWQALWMKRRFGLPYLISENYTGFDTSSRSDQPKGLRPFSRIITKNAAFVCPVTKNLEAVMKNFGLPGRYHIVPNVVNTDLFRIRSPREERLRFLHISTLSDAHKNISGILRCWKKCSDVLPEIHLQLGGDGPVDIYRNMSSVLGIRSDSISFFGTQSPPEVAALMYESDCLLLFSNYENLPLVMIESLACGMAIISTNAGGVAEHIHENLGFVIQKRDEEALVLAIMKYAADPDKFIPENQRQYAIDHFSIPSIVAQFNVVYRKMLSGQ